MRVHGRGTVGNVRVCLTIAWAELRKQSQSIRAISTLVNYWCFKGGHSVTWHGLFGGWMSTGGLSAGTVKMLVGLAKTISSMCSKAAERRLAHSLWKDARIRHTSSCSLFGQAHGGDVCAQRFTAQCTSFKFRDSHYTHDLLMLERWYRLAPPATHL